MIDILGGRIEGPRLNGRILPGADWQIVRPDGATDLQARYAIETDRGTRILVTSDGLRHGPRGHRRARSGDAVDPRALFPHPDAVRDRRPPLTWLNRILALGTGAREKLAVRLDVYEVV